MIVFLYKHEGGADAVFPKRGGVANKLHHDTDAGTAPLMGEDFVIEAPDAAAALDAARRWLANWADENDPNVPDDLMLVQRGVGLRSYMALRVGG